jgi:hypothetical protein
MKTFIETYGIWIVVIGTMLLCLMYFGIMLFVVKKYNNGISKKLKENDLIKIGLLLKKYDQPDVSSLEKFLDLEIECITQESIAYPALHRGREQYLEDMKIDYDWLVLNTDETFDDNVRYEL